MNFFLFLLCSFLCRLHEMCLYTKKLIIILSSTVFVPSPYFGAVTVYDVHINDCVC